MAPVILTKRLAVIVSNTRKFTREGKQEKEFYDAFHNSQFKETSNLTDVKLICDGGTISVHAIILQAVSPFFLAAIESQGDNYLVWRDIILPDVPVEEMQKAMQIVYTGSVNCTEDEAESLNELLTELQIESRGNIVTKKTNKKIEEAPLIRVNRRNIKNSIKFENDAAEETRIINKKLVELEAEEVNAPSSPGKTVKDSSSDEEKNKGEDSRVRKTRSGRKILKRKGNYNDSDYEPTTDEEKEERVKKSKVPKSNPRVEATPTKHKGSTSVKPAVAAVIPSKKVKSGKKNDSNKRGDWQEPNYTDKDWFDREAKTCQYCDKVYSSPADASKCITGHQHLRCYFCFRICKNTEKLFEHFRHDHKQAGRENCLLCPYCEQTIPFKSVSCHVISLHLSDMKNGEKTDDKNVPATPAKNKATTAVTIPYRPRKNPGRPAAIETRISSDVSDKVEKEKTKKLDKGSGSGKKVYSTSGRPVSGTPAKKRRISGHKKILERTLGADKEGDGKIRVGDLDCTIRRKGIDGRIWVWRIQKKVNSGHKESINLS